MMESTNHAVDDGKGYRLPERAWRELEETRAQLEFLAALFDAPRPACPPLRRRLEDPRHMALCLRVLARQLARVRRHARPL